MNSTRAIPPLGTPAERFEAGLERLNRLREFAGPAEAFWPLLLETTTLLAGARYGLLYRQAPGEVLQHVAAWPADAPGCPGLPVFLRAAPEAARAAAQREAALAPLNGVSSGPQPYALAVRWHVASSGSTLVTVYYLEAASETQAAAALRHLRLVSDVPSLYQWRKRAAEAQVTLAHLAAVTDLIAQLNARERFAALALTLVNELASRHQCTRVGLGWCRGPYVRLQALSHTDRFEKKWKRSASSSRPWKRRSTKTTSSAGHLQKTIPASRAIMPLTRPISPQGSSARSRCAWMGSPWAS